MRLTAILLTVAFLQVQAKSYPQITLSLKNVSVEKVFYEIERQSGYGFLYTKAMLADFPAVTIKVKNASVDEVLNECFKGQPMAYTIEDKVIVVTKRRFTNPERAPDPEPVPPVEIHGRVVSSTGEPLSNVSVIVAGTSVGTTTGVDGRFVLTAPDNKDIVLEFSSVGYQTKRVNAGNQTEVDVVLELEVAGLSDVVVVGYGTQKKVNLTGAVSQISSERLENRSVTNIDQALQGVAPGLNLTTNGTYEGEPNAKMGMNIRGQGSLSGGSPYVLVDGAPMNLNDVNPNDVESISVLKDAASTAIYGSRAAYGVILVTTKSGKENNQIKTNYSNFFTWDQPTYLPGFVNSLRFANTINEAATNSGQNNIFSDETIEWIKRYQADPVNTPSMIPDPRDPNGWGYWNLGHANTDWYDVLYKDWSFSQKHNVSISGGSKKATYYLGAGWLDNAGKLNFANEKFERFNITSNVSFQITRKLTAFLRTKFNRDFQRFHNGQIAGDRYSFFESMAGSWPTDPVYTPNGDFTLDKNQPAVLSSSAGSDIQKTINAWFSPSLELKLTKDWKVTADMSYNYNGSKRSTHRAIIWGLATDGVTPITQYSQNWNRMYHDLTYFEYFTSNVFSEFTKQINRHHLDILIGGQSEVANYFDLNGWRRDLITELVPAISTAIGDKDVDDNMSAWSTLGSFARVTYNFDERYLFEVNGRYDGSSRFQKGRRWGFFPSASVGYNISKENFWSPIKHVINNLKLRASYGSLGNQNVANYLYEETIPVITNLNWIIDGTRPVYASVPSNRSIGLTWETAETINLGIDGQILNNRLSFSLDWYTRKTINMFGPGESLPAVYGAAVPLKNNAVLKTKGVELSVDWKDHISDKLNYSIGLVFSDNKSIITKYNNPTKLISNFFEGQTYGDIWGYVSEGIFQSDEEASKWVDQSLFYSKWGAGDVKYKDLDGDGKITNGNQTLGNTGDMKVIGNSQPRYLFGINVNINYKSFDFTMFWQGVGKRDFWVANPNFFGFRSAWYETTVAAHALDYWSPDNTDAYFARPYLTVENFKNQQVQSRFLQHASYTRLKNMQVGYSLQDNIVRKLGMDKVRIYIGGENLLTFSGMLKSFDPETNFGSSGGALVYPLSRTISTGINITF